MNGRQKPFPVCLWQAFQQRNPEHNKKWGGFFLPVYPEASVEAAFGANIHFGKGEKKDFLACSLVDHSEAKPGSP